MSPLARLQHTAGNQTVQRLLGTAAPVIDAAPGTTDTRVSSDQDPEHLTAPDLAGAQFDEAYHDAPPLGVGDARTEAVGTLQTLLAERFGLAALLPVTFRTGEADGRWGEETTRAVRAFQQDHGVRPVGGWEAGHKTLLAMDRALPPVPPTPAVPRIELSPAIGAEAGPKHWLGDVPYRIDVVADGLPPATLARIQFADDLPAITMTATGASARPWPESAGPQASIR